MMKLPAKMMVGLVAVLHIGFLVLEMFLWNHPIGAKVFKLPPDIMKGAATLAANQGLYNGFLAAGLIWGLVAKKRDVVIFFLICVVIAGIYGGLTAKVTILFVQATPGAIALLLAWMMGEKGAEAEVS